MNNNVKYVCNKGECTACNSCVSACPVQCITYHVESTGTSVAVINESVCVQCGLCKTVCPQNSAPLSLLHQPQECYASWSNSSEVREKSASGGVAFEMYKSVLAEGGVVAGVALSEEGIAKYRLTDSQEDLSAFQNSKYVFSDTGTVFPEIAQMLKAGKKVLFIGLPCQVVGLNCFLRAKRVDMEDLRTADLVCHGVTPTEFLSQHIQRIESEKKIKTTEISFRDPEAYTYTYTFTLRNKGKVFYARRVDRNDLYQIGYHRGITYRDNCYKCNYACEARSGDLTLADFSYVGKVEPCEYTNKNVSCVMVNSAKGASFLNSLWQRGCVFLERRPLEEELDFEPQLQHPTQMPAERRTFLQEYSITKDFEASMRKSTRKIVLKNEIYYYFKVEALKKIAIKLIPKKLKEYIKKTGKNK